jgi:hypothetical protein
MYTQPRCHSLPENYGDLPTTTLRPSYSFWPYLQLLHHFGHPSHDEPLRRSGVRSSHRGLFELLPSYSCPLSVGACHCRGSLRWLPPSQADLTRSAPSSPTPSHTWSVETQHVLHGDGLRRLVLCKNASVYPAPENLSSASNTNIHGVDYELFLRRIGRGVGDDWVCRVRVMPSTVNLDVRLWDSKRSEDDKIEVQLGKPLLRSSPLKRILNNSIRKDSIELGQSRPIRSRLRSARSNIHRRRVVIDIGAKGTDELTPSLVRISLFETAQLPN